MERIAIFAALRWECRPVLRPLRQIARVRVAAFTAWHATTGQREVWLVNTGVGMAQAAAAARAVGDAGSFDLFLSTGCAGALAQDLAPGDLTVATTVIRNPPGDRFETNAEYRDSARRAAERAALRTVVGPVLCSPHVLTTAAQKRAAAAERGAVAVETEGAPIAAHAAAHGIPFASVRAILDTADTELRDAGQFIDPQSGTVKPFALAAYLAAHPGAWSNLLAMQRMMQAAQRSLEKFFGAWLGGQ